MTTRLPSITLHLVYSGKFISLVSQNYLAEGVSVFLCCFFFSLFCVFVKQLHWNPFNAPQNLLPIFPTFAVILATNQRPAAANSLTGMCKGSAARQTVTSRACRLLF